MSLAPPAESSSGATRKTFATARYGFSRPRPFASASSISPALSSMRTWKCRWPGSTPSRWASSRFVSCQSPSWPSISSTRTRSGWPSAFNCSGLSSTSVSCKRTARPFGLRGALLHIERAMSSSKLGCCSAIEDCRCPAAAGPDEAGRRVGAWFQRESPARGLGLLGAGDREKDLARAVQSGDAQRYPVDEGLQPGLRREHTLALLQGRCIREQGCDVTVLADAEQLEIEHDVADLLLVVGGRPLLPELALDAMDGARVALEPVEQRAFCKRIVREVVVRWNAAFVAPPDLRLAPVGLALRRFFVRQLGRRTTRERDVPAFARRARQPLGHHRGDFARVLDHDELDVAVQESPAASSFERSIAAFLRDRHKRSLRRVGQTMFPPRAPFFSEVRLPTGVAARRVLGGETVGEPPGSPRPPPRSAGARVTNRLLRALSSAPSPPVSH